MPAMSICDKRSQMDEAVAWGICPKACPMPIVEGALLMSTSAIQTLDAINSDAAFRAMIHHSNDIMARSKINLEPAA